MKPPPLTWRAAERPLVWVVAVVLGAVHAAGSAFAMNPDGISYLHLADSYARGEWAAAVNAYWSPVYPLLLSAVMTVVKPSPYWEAPLAHGLNFLLFLGAFAGFRFFLGAVRRIQRNDTPDAEGKSFAFSFEGPIEAACVHIVFFMTALNWIGLDYITPDLVVATIVFGASGYALLLRGSPRRRGYFVLGVVCALGYLTKAIMFPLGVLFLLLAAWERKNRRRTATQLAFAFAGFLLLAAPQLISVSKKVGRVSYAETGTLAYARLVNGYPMFWTGEPEGSGHPLHPMRVVNSHPRTLAFPVADSRSSYPFWEEPAHWLAGIEPHFDLPAQLRASKPLLKSYVEWTSTILLVLIILSVTRDRRGWASSYAWLILACLGAFGLYALVHAETRFLGAWATILFISIAASARFAGGAAQTLKATLLALAIFEGWAVIANTVRVGKGAIANARSGFSIHPQFEVGRNAVALGVRPGSRVAVIGSGSNGYWARLAGVQIAMVTPDQSSYWSAPDAEKAALHARLREAGASAIIANRVPQGAQTSGWLPIGTDHYMMLLGG